MSLIKVLFISLLKMFLSLGNRGETLNAMGYDSGAGVLQNAVPTFYA